VTPVRQVWQLVALRWSMTAPVTRVLALLTMAGALGLGPLLAVAAAGTAYRLSPDVRSQSTELLAGAYLLLLLGLVTAAVASEIGDEGGTLTVTVTSSASERIDELVLRFPTELSETLVIAPFTPSEDRIVEGGPPLVQPWTKWVIGPGEMGEPEGTTSIGWGPLFPDATLTIELDVTREAAGPVEFDLQILAGNDLLTLDDGEPAELRVEVP